MSKINIEPYQFEPTYPEGEEPVSDESEKEEPDTNNGNDRRGTTEWCSCENCISMDTDLESICCQELDVLNEKFDSSGVDCIIDHHKFAVVCLDHDVLKTALVAMHNSRCTPQQDSIENRTWRLTAYRQFTTWVHGYLGKRTRRPIPSCVVKAVRSTFPEQSGVYVGFKEAE
ncbi:hypothetical protein QZH41_016904, partial [Actinostola sp. cb2023]